jgi:hypothetical protein
VKVLVDACAGGRLAQALGAAGHDVVFVGDWDKDPGCCQGTQSHNWAKAEMLKAES